MASSFVVYYSVYGMFATHLQKDLHFDAAMTATPIALANLVAFLASGFWGGVADRLGRRWAMIIPAAIGFFITPLYLFTTSYVVIAGAYIVQGAFLGAIYGQNPSYLAERFPTEVRATAAGFCYHQGAIWAGFAGGQLYTPVAPGFARPLPLPAQGGFAGRVAVLGAKSTDRALILRELLRSLQSALRDRLGSSVPMSPRELVRAAAEKKLLAPASLRSLEEVLALLSAGEVAVMNARRLSLSDRKLQALHAAVLDILAEMMDQENRQA